MEGLLRILIGERINGRGIILKPIKREKIHMVGSCHTLDIKSDGLVHGISDDIKHCIEISSSERKNGIVSKSRINPNKLFGDVESYSDLELVMDTLTEAVGITDYVYSRFDFRLDSYSEKYYEEYAKLNRLILSLIAVTYNVENTFESKDLFSNKLLSMSIRNTRLQVECYDKAAESKGKDRATCRLELRSVKMNTTDIKWTFINDWFRWLDKSSKSFKKVEMKYNKELAKLYHEEKKSYPVQFRSWRDFILQYQNCIFSNRQLVDLLRRMGISNPTGKAKEFKNDYSIEFFSQTDIDYTIKLIKSAALQYFNS